MQSDVSATNVLLAKATSFKSKKDTLETRVEQALYLQATHAERFQRWLQCAQGV